MLEDIFPRHRISAPVVLFGIDQRPNPASRGFSPAPAFGVMFLEPALKVQRPANISDEPAIFVSCRQHIDVTGHSPCVPRLLHGWQGAKMGLYGVRDGTMSLPRQ
jgi:hypothetical protein